MEKLEKPKTKSVIPTNNSDPGPTAKNKESFRGYIKSNNSSIYYILNEIISSENIKVFSAVKIDKDSQDKVENKKLCIKHISKDFIKSEIMLKLNIEGVRMEKFYSSLRKKFETYKQMETLEEVQELEDYIEDESGLYIVFKYYEHTLKDYINMKREQLKFDSSIFEIKVRDIIYQIMNGLLNIQKDTVCMYLGGQLNSGDIMIHEDSDTIRNKNSISVKLPHPFMTDLLTIFKIYNTENFPTFYAPEIYELFSTNEYKAIVKKDSFDLNNLTNKISHVMDMWSLGNLIYEILFGELPFDFDSLSSVSEALKDNKLFYSVYPKKISTNMLQVITRCLQRDPSMRMTTETLFDLTNEIQKENENLEDLEKILKIKRADVKNLQKEVAFNVYTFNDYQNY